jgi:hypothetical protein
MSNTDILPTLRRAPQRPQSAIGRIRLTGVNNTVKAWRSLVNGSPGARGSHRTHRWREGIELLIPRVRREIRKDKLSGTYTPAAAGGLVEELSERRPSNPEDFHTYSFERVLADIRDARDRDQAKVFSPRESLSSDALPR